MEPRAVQTNAYELLFALALAILLTLAWTLSDWANLSVLRLPDTDDVMRLQQIRDWIGGQPFADLTQYRLGAAPGLTMHWSRLPDLVPSAIIVSLTPLVGAHAAEMTAVIVWPALLFAALLILTASIARALGQSGPTAAILAALAYPAATLFTPGRIDHHGFQLVLILMLVRALLGGGSLRGGAVAGFATAASLAIGLETAPLLAVGGGAVLLFWIVGKPGAHARLLGYAATLVLALVAGSALLRTSGWAYPACDGFTAELWRGATLAALAVLVLALTGFASLTPKGRAIAGAIAIAAAGVAVLVVSPGCLSPYGDVDPLLARLWLAKVAEAQPLFAAPLAHAIGYGGLAVVGLAASAWMAWRTRGAGWVILLAFQCAALVVTFAQLRGAYAGAVLGVPALAALIAQARTRGVLALAGAWIVSAGLVYPMLGGMLAARPVEGVAVADCTAPEALARIAALPPGTVMAPVDLGTFALASSPHRVVAAPYHRNTQGNRAMYDFFVGPVAQSEAIARQWHVDYVALCPDSFDELGAGGLAGELRAGRVSTWLRPVSAPGAAPMLYAVRPQ